MIMTGLCRAFPQKADKSFFFPNANLIMSLFIFVVCISMLFNTYSLEEHLDMLLHLSIYLTFNEQQLNTQFCDVTNGLTNSTN